MRKIVLGLLMLSSLLFAKAYTLQSVDGKVYHFDMTSLGLQVAEFPGKIIILDFFGATCPPCIAEFPDLIQFQEGLHEDLQIIGIQAGSRMNDQKIAAFSKKHGLNYPVINLKEANDLIAFAQKEYDWNGALPFKLIYDSDGTLSYNAYGMMNWKKLMQVIREL